jgi:hypothetical protein
MKDFLKKNILPLLSLLISIATLLLFWCRLEPFTWDSFGATTAVMGVIVTFLVGFQIWAVIDTSRFKSEIKAEQKEVEETLQKVVYQELINQSILLDIFYNIKSSEPIKDLKNKELQYIEERIRKAIII